MIEGSVQIAGHEIRVQDEQLMIFIPGAEGNSEPLDHTTLRKLEAITGLAFIHHEQTLRKHATGYPYPKPESLEDRGFVKGVNG